MRLLLLELQILFTEGSLAQGAHFPCADLYPKKKRNSPPAHSCCHFSLLWMTLDFPSHRLKDIVLLWILHHDALYLYLRWIWLHLLNVFRSEWGSVKTRGWIVKFHTSISIEVLTKNNIIFSNLCAVLKKKTWAEKCTFKNPVQLRENI